MPDAASPQLEDGYTRIANELFDAVLTFPFSARQLKVVMTIIRKTYGYNKKRDDMSASQIGEACGLARSHVTAVLGELASMNVIRKQPGRFGSIIEINKKCGEWTSTKSVRGCTESVLPNEAQSDVQASTESVQVASTKSVHTKDNLPKDKEQNTDTGPESDDTIGEVIRYLNERAGRNFRTSKSNTKFVAARLKGGATLEQCKAVIDAKVAQWANDPKMAEYLRPETLFNETKFESYLGALNAKRAEENKKPELVL